jgi:hypothetical protein
VIAQGGSTGTLSFFPSWPGGVRKNVERQDVVTASWFPRSGIKYLLNQTSLLWKRGKHKSMDGMASPRERENVLATLPRLRGFVYYVHFQPIFVGTMLNRDRFVRGSVAWRNDIDRGSTKCGVNPPSLPLDWSAPSPILAAPGTLKVSPACVTSA